MAQDRLQYNGFGIILLQTLGFVLLPAATCSRLRVRHPNRAHIFGARGTPRNVSNKTEVSKTF
jgi:hypothetical protein